MTGLTPETPGAAADYRLRQSPACGEAGEQGALALMPWIGAMTMMDGRATAAVPDQAC
ncbi:MAG: hypothetical protein R2712_07385 [Vicinamibacterales bacterium]